MSDHEAAERYVKAFIDSVNARDSVRMESLMSGSVRSAFSSEDIENLFSVFSAPIKEPEYKFVMASGADFYDG